MLADLKFWMRWLRWWLRMPYEFGDPSLGSGEVRQHNRDTLRRRYYESEPKRSQDS